MKTIYSPRIDSDRSTAPRGDARRAVRLRFGRVIGLAALTGVVLVPALPTGAQAPPVTALSRLAGASVTPREVSGQTVTVTGQVTASGQVLGSPAVTLDDPTTVATERVLVIGRPRDMARLGRLPLGTTLRVAGTVRVFDRSDLSQIAQQAGITVDPALADLMVNRPVLLARAVQTADGASEQARAGAHGAVGAIGAVGAQAQVPRVTPAQVEQDILQGRGQLAGRTVSLTGQITNILNSRAIALENGVLVIGSQPLEELLFGPVIIEPSRRPWFPPERRGMSPLQPGDTVQAVGEVLAFDPTSLSRELGVDLRGPTFQNWAGRPVIIAHSFQSRPNVQIQSGGRAVVEGRVSQATPVNLAQLLGNPQQYLDRPIIVTDTVTDIIGPQTFVLGRALLVAGATDAAVPLRLRPGDTVQ
ncbi:MAG TPA: hypothetical protein VGW38_14135, partial [Chloroflexota bacterium]|nr:hypothetical protein [Chloroflexota bacterium]